MTLTDDSDRANFSGGYCETFDYDPDPWYDDDPAPKCGGSCQNEWGEETGCPGCRHCFPPDSEAIHTGFETWDRPDFWAARRELNMLADMGYALRPDPFGCSNGWAYFLRVIGFDARLLRAAEHKLARICDRAETHADAVREYERWAKLARA